MWNLNLEKYLIQFSKQHRFLNFLDNKFFGLIFRNFIKGIVVLIISGVGYKKLLPKIKGKINELL